MKNRQEIKNFGTVSTQMKYIKFEESKKPINLHQSINLKRNGSNIHFPHGGQYWWCCKCGTCNEGSYCYKESCGHEQCSSCQI